MKPPSTVPSFEAIEAAVATDPFWSAYFHDLVHGHSGEVAVHLAVFVEPFLSYVLEGKKTIESRFSVMRCAPYGRVKAGDVILLKESSGPVVGLCLVDHAWFYTLDPDSWRTIRDRFTDALCAQDPQFWKSRERAAYATLMRVGHVHRIEPVPWKKRDRRGWVLLRTGSGDNLFEGL